MTGMEYVVCGGMSVYTYDAVLLNQSAWVLLRAVHESHNICLRSMLGVSVEKKIRKKK